MTKNCGHIISFGKIIYKRNCLRLIQSIALMIFFIEIMHENYLIKNSWTIMKKKEEEEGREGYNLFK